MRCFFQSKSETKGATLSGRRGRGRELKIPGMEPIPFYPRVYFIAFVVPIVVISWIGFAQTSSRHLGSALLVVDLILLTLGIAITIVLYKKSVSILYFVLSVACVLSLLIVTF